MEPCADLLTRLLHAEVEGQHLSEDDIFSFFQLLLLAGTETTTNLIANSVIGPHLAPGRRKRMCAQKHCADSKAGRRNAQASQRCGAQQPRNNN